MSKKNGVTFPECGNDFYKSNGMSVVCHTPGPSLTRQEFLEECDINSIMKRYEATGASINGLTPVGPPMYVDFTEMPLNLIDYMAFMADAEKAFMSLPAGVRREFDNSAPAFVEFASDPANLEQMRAWGLAPAPEKPPEKPAPMEVTIVQAAPAAGSSPPTHGST